MREGVAGGGVAAAVAAAPVGITISLYRCTCHTLPSMTIPCKVIMHSSVTFECSDVINIEHSSTSDNHANLPEYIWVDAKA